MLENIAAYRLVDDTSEMKKKIMILFVFMFMRDNNLK